MVEKISVQIGLEGGKEVEQQLTDIGETGEKAFDRINKAADDVGLEKVGEAGQTAADGIAKTGEAADKASESMSKLSLEAVKTSTEIAKNAAEFVKIGVEIGLLVTRHESLAVSLIKTVLHVRSLVVALEAVPAVLGPVGIAVGATVVALGGLVLALEAAAKAAEAIANPYQKLSQNLETLSANTGRTFDSLQQGKAAFAELGISGENFASVITKVNEALASFDVGAKLKESAAEAKSAINEVLEAERQLILLRQKSEGRELTFAESGRLAEISALVDKVGALEAAEQKLGEARENAAKKAANSLQTLLPIIDQIIAGEQGIKFDGMVTAEGKIRALTAAMKQAEEKGKSAGQALNEFIANADRLSAIQVGAKFGITEEQVDNIRLLKDSITEIWDRAKSQPPLFSPESRAAMAELRKATADLAKEQVRLQQAWDSSIFARFAAGYLTMVANMKAATIGWLASVLETGNTFPARFAAWFSTLPAAVQASIAQAGAAWNWMIGVIKSAGSAVLEFAASLPGIAWDAITSAGTAAWNAIVSAARTAKAAVLDFAASLPGMAWDAITSAAASAWAAIMQGAADAKAWVLDFAASLPGIAWDAITSAATSAWAAIMQGAADAKQAVLDFAASLAGIAWDAIKSAGVAAWNAITSAIRQAINATLTLIGLTGSGGSAPAAASAPGKARGGLLGGRGTGTSDSNLAWVSRGEHIMPARAVAQPGVLAFLEALRRSGGNLSRVLDGMGRFALGGMIRSPMPAFAAGGLAGGMSNVTIQFPGLPAIGGLRASSDVVDQLHKAAALAQVRSGGRKPSRYS